MIQRARITLDDMAHGGDAVGRHEGKVLFVPLGLPGETVQVEWNERGRAFAHATLLRVEEASPQRVTPPCPYFGRCGGCQWQHAAYEAQLAFKEEILYSQLVRIGKQHEPDVRPMLGMDEPWNYRNHVQLRVDARNRVGYYALKSHDIVPVETCPIAHPLLETMWSVHQQVDTRASRIALRAGIHTGDRLAVIEGQSETLPLLKGALPYHCVYVTPSGAMHRLSGDDHYTERLLGRPFRVSANVFFQNNTLQAERLIAVCQDYLALQPGETLLDAYCGVGTLGLSLVPERGQLLGIESWPPAVSDARHNASGQARFWQGEVEQVLQEEDLQADAIVLDPPRAGCAPEALEAMADCGASRIVYVSCDPATLSRDIARLNTLGYALRQVQPVDLFTQTFHVETVVLMSRVDE